MPKGFRWYPNAKRQVDHAFAGALEAAARAVVADVEERQVVPRAPSARKPGHVAGRLASSVGVDPTRAASGTVRVTWDAPFAARAYFHPEWEFSREVHGSAKGRWMDDYKAGGGRSGVARDAYRKALGRSRWFL